ncbi:MAG TPA: pyruvate ferredoxin oxidoreductase [Candidatus Latescibacteria bacterium]|nr:pyruvate ferredoxin oxidoreductase [Candidatus Latescibacterota bacterium]
MPTLKELSRKPELFSPGHRLCAGCGASIVVRQILLATDTPVVVGSATGCLEVATTIFPHTAWRCSFIHCAFENVAATISGVESAYRVLKRRGRIQKDFRFIAFGGDGGTYDIGLQALSGVCERGHRMLYICYDNQAYMNTGIQRSGATPCGAWTTTSPVGKASAGKRQRRKDLTAIIIAHNIPYVAQASPSRWNDLVTKTQKALQADGPSFINVLSPCPRGWRYESSETIRLAQLAVDTCFWPLYEVNHGKWRLTYRPKEKMPVAEWLKEQGRFKHLFREENKWVIEQLQADVDRQWETLLARCEG